jgi:hypothetical protein
MAFAIVVWGAVVLALVVFAYEVYALATGFGLLGGDDTRDVE